MAVVPTTCNYLLDYIYHKDRCTLQISEISFDRTYKSVQYICPDYGGNPIIKQLYLKAADLDRVICFKSVLHYILKLFHTNVSFSPFENGPKYLGGAYVVLVGIR